eukprot:750365-Rhodomonas_salina.1
MRLVPRAAERPRLCDFKIHLTWVGFKPYLGSRIRVTLSTIHPRTNLYVCFILYRERRRGRGCQRPSLKINMTHAGFVISKSVISKSVAISKSMVFKVYLGSRKRVYRARRRGQGCQRPSPCPPPARTPPAPARDRNGYHVSSEF